MKPAVLIVTFVLSARYMMNATGLSSESIRFESLSACNTVLDGIKKDHVQSPIIVTGSCIEFEEGKKDEKQNESK
jgi:hypothetical protein